MFLNIREAHAYLALAMIDQSAIENYVLPELAGGSIAVFARHLHFDRKDRTKLGEMSSTDS